MGCGRQQAAGLTPFVSLRPALEFSPARNRRRCTQLQTSGSSSKSSGSRVSGAHCPHRGARATCDSGKQGVGPGLKAVPKPPVFLTAKRCLPHNSPNADKVDAGFSSGGSGVAAGAAHSRTPSAPGWMGGVHPGPVRRCSTTSSKRNRLTRSH